MEFLFFFIYSQHLFFFMSNLYKRPTNKGKIRQQHYKTNKKHPIGQIVSTVPQLAITLAILFCLSTYYQADLIQQ